MISFLKKKIKNWFVYTVCLVSKCLLNFDGFKPVDICTKHIVIHVRPCIESRFIFKPCIVLFMAFE